MIPYIDDQYAWMIMSKEREELTSYDIYYLKKYCPLDPRIQDDYP